MSVAPASLSRLQLDYTNVPVVLESITGINVHSYKNGHNGWFQKGSNVPFGQVVEYEYKTPSGEMAQYRTWYMETSYMAQGQGLMVSTKIDNVLGGLTKDDHIMLICGFGPGGLLSVVEASLQINGGGPIKAIAPITRPVDGDPNQLDDLMYDQLAATHYGVASRDAIAYIVKANIISLRNSVRRH